MMILSVGVLCLIACVFSVALWGILNFSMWWTEMVLLGDHHLTLALLAIALMILSAAALELLAARREARSRR